MEVTLVHPTDKDKKVVATHPQQVAAYTSRGFVVEADTKNEESEKKTEKEKK